MQFFACLLLAQCKNTSEEHARQEQTHAGALKRKRGGRESRDQQASSPKVSVLNQITKQEWCLFMFVYSYWYRLALLGLEK